MIRPCFGRVGPGRVGRGAVGLVRLAEDRGLLEHLVADPGCDLAAALQQQVERLGLHLAGQRRRLTAPLWRLAMEDAEVELEAEVDRRRVREPVDEGRREELEDPVLGLAVGGLDDIAPIELHALEALLGLRPMIVVPVVEGPAELVGPAGQERDVADALRDPADHDRVLTTDVDSEGLAERRLMAQPPDGASRHRPRQRPDRMLDRPRLLCGGNVSGVGLLLAQHQISCRGVLAEPLLAAAKPLERLGLVTDHLSTLAATPPDRNPRVQGWCSGENGSVMGSQGSVR